MTQDAAQAESRSTTDQVKEQVAQQARVAQDSARGTAEQARSRFSEQIEQRSTQAGERLRGTAADVRSVADELRRQGKDVPARMVEQAAAQTDRVADYLKVASGERILRDVEDFARRQPWAVAAGGLALGFVASRLLKASSSRRYHTDRGGSRYGGENAALQSRYRAPSPEAAEQAEQPAVTPYPVVEPVVPSADVPVVEADDPAAPTAITGAPASSDLIDSEERPPRAQ